MTTNSPTPTPPTSKPMLWTGRVITALPLFMMGGVGLLVLIAFPNQVTEGMNKYGYPPTVGRPLLIIEITCALLYLIPQTAVLGAILLTGYLGGAVATHVHASEPFFLPLIFGILVWLGLYLRDPRIRALVPLRR